MINLFPRTKAGAATLVFAVVLLVISTLIVMFAANQGLLQDKSTSNFNRANEAYQAAEAGIEFGISYLKQNESTIIASPSGGYISYSDANTTNVTLTNGSKYSLVYTNPVANNYQLIRITSTGTNSDSTATRTMRLDVQRGSLLMNTGNVSLTTKGSVIVFGNAVLANTSTNQNIQAAQSVTITGQGKTVTSTGTSSDASVTGPDVQANNSALANTSPDDFFANYFGTTNTAVVQGKLANVYTNSTDTNYSNILNGMQGTSIWINQTNGTTATLSGNIVIGSVSNPVLLVVNGSFNIAGNVTIYGFIYITGSSGFTSQLGSNNLIGGLASTDNASISGNTTLTFNPTVLDNLKNSSAMKYFAKVPGSWKDF